MACKQTLKAGNNAGACGILSRRELLQLVAIDASSSPASFKRSQSGWGTIGQLQLPALRILQAPTIDRDLSSY